MSYDILLVHAPSVYDFRNRGDICFAYLSTSATVHVSPVFEMPPVGIFAIEQHLQRAGFNVEFFNIASRMLRDSTFDVPSFFKKVPAKYFGVDLHWLLHCHGSLELAKIYKSIFPDAKTMFGGIASTYFHDQLIQYPQVDYVVRGYDTLLPVEQLVKSDNDPTKLAAVPNLTWKRGGETVVNEMTHVPQVYSAAVDWRQVFAGRKGMQPYNLVLPQAGCEYNCTWCGGSRRFFRKYMGLKKRVQKTPEVFRNELQSIAEATPGKHTTVVIDFWHETKELMDVAEDIFVDDRMSAAHFMMHRIPPPAKARTIAGLPIKQILELSPDSHDMEVAKAAGRGHYSMEEMEAFIDEFVDRMYAFEIYFMIGLPKQTTKSVWDTVDYCEHLLKKYQGKRVMPYVAPMLPFLDPGSQIWDEAEEFGYTIRHKTLEAHRLALLEMNWRDRLNYETKWMNRQELTDVSYDAVKKLTELKAQYGSMSKGMAAGICALLDETKSLLKELDDYKAMPEGPDKERIGAVMADRVRVYNDGQFRKIRTQQRPVDLGFSKQQWFDTDEAFDRVLKGEAAPSPRKLAQDCAPPVTIRLPDAQLAAPEAAAKRITRVWIEPGCIGCRHSSEYCSDVFEMREAEHRTVVRQGVDYQRYDREIREAAASCPVGVIKFEETTDIATPPPERSGSARI